MVDAGEEVMHVSFENPPIGSAHLSSVVIDHVLLQPHQTIVGAFTGLTGEIVPNEALRDGFIQDVVYDRVEDDFVHERGRLDEPLLRLIDIKHLKPARNVGLGVQDR